MDRHIRIAFASGPTFDYRVSGTAAEHLESTLRDWSPDAEITVDNHVTDALPALPCASLWEP